MDPQFSLLTVLLSIDFEGAEEAVTEALKERVLPILQANATAVKAGSDGSFNVNIIGVSGDSSSSGSSSKDGGKESSASASRDADKALAPRYMIAKKDQDDILTRTDPAQVSVLWILALTAKFGNQSADASEFFALVNRLFDNISGTQAKLVPEHYRALLYIIAAASDAIEMPILSLRPLLNAALSFSPIHDILSPAHPLFLIQALKAKQYKLALQLLKYDVDKFDSAYGLTYHDHLRFHYYGAMVFIGMKQYQKAIEYLAIVLCAPGFPCSMVQIEALKKTVLLQLILYGKHTLKLPRMANDFTSHSYRAFARPYDHFAVAFENGDPTILKLVWNQIKGIFTADGNYGLALHALTAFRKQRIQKLRKTFITVTMEYIESKDVDILENGPSTKEFVLAMIADGDLRAKISQKSSTSPITVIFQDASITSSHLDELEAKLNSVRQLNEKIAAADREVGQSREFLNRKLQSASTPGGFLGRGAGLEDLEGNDDSMSMMEL
ncbi:hypothetical protein POJ06DRAFT_14927 [Lipomyces tetrasporus]|uniref:COP9 signalosome complex subunit 3 N-terminal helical repeats domain-containing protein n=1 Tax=Lipomyces tetrasporus TaxID=54092 RepID=A0AAD7QZ89_9ASCO|nr:uncharacterized protein POJ06DRAFT_14927 [Lipomyces tetrasporus]KAJ8104191.1 hypothetical protein POJ06DRAFT_14927 [Lipomyces tetrasporus]